MLCQDSKTRTLFIMSQSLTFPLITGQTSVRSESIATVYQDLLNSNIVIPDYQRDSEEWDDDVKSLFIESILNRLTIPAFFFYPDTQQHGLISKTVYEVVDGQQRLTTIKQFRDDQLTLSTQLQYLSPQATFYAGKKFSDLDPAIQRIFDDYKLSIIELPYGLSFDVRLEIFRRINQNSTPLTGQDIRLAYYTNSDSVLLIRLAGLYDYSSPFTQRITNSSVSVLAKVASKMQSQSPLSDLWAINPTAKDIWQNWWKGKERAKGQTPSLMFLWYLTALNYSAINSLLQANLTYLGFPLSSNFSTETVLDIYCAQLRHQDRNPSQPAVLFDFNQIFDRFKTFQDYFEDILINCQSISVDKYKQFALLVAGLVACQKSCKSFNQSQWNNLNTFISNPRQATPNILKGVTYPEPKGRWSAQVAQFQVVRDVAQAI